MDETTNRFMKYVDCSLGPDACWFWTGVKVNGYGQFYAHGKKIRAHRWAYEHLGSNPPPGDLSVCHRCDNPPCVNPKHLFTGSVSENARDSVEKGRHWTKRKPEKARANIARNMRFALGEKHSQSKLTLEDVRECIAARKHGISSRRLAEKFGVNPSSIQKVWKGRTHLARLALAEAEKELGG